MYLPWNGKCWYILHIAIRDIVRPFGIFLAIWLFCGHLVYFSRFGLLNEEKSGNPGGHAGTL
jgi:hypothetical protein